MSQENFPTKDDLSKNREELKISLREKRKIVAGKGIMSQEPFHNKDDLSKNRAEIKI